MGQELADFFMACLGLAERLQPLGQLGGSFRALVGHELSGSPSCSAEPTTLTSPRRRSTHKFFNPYANAPRKALNKYLFQNTSATLTFLRAIR